MRNFSSIKTEPLQVEIVKPRALIYYSKGSDLLRVDPQSQNDSVKTLETQGEIGQLDLNASKSQVTYEVKSATGNWEIWQGDFNNIQKEKIAPDDSAQELVPYENFSAPKYSPDKNKLSYLAQSSSSDAIIIQDIVTGDLEKVEPDTKIKIADYSWNNKSDSLIYCSSNPPAGGAKNACFVFNLANKQNTKAFEREIKKVSWSKTDNIFYLSSGETPHIYTANIAGGSPVQIDDVSSPKNIINFQINNQGEKIVYEIVADQKSDIYLSNIDGSNRLQLTTDGLAHQPIFSPEDEIAYLRQKDGIYTIESDKTNERKIISLEDTINNLLIWG